MNEIDSEPNPKIKARVVQDAPDELGRRKWRIQHYQQEQQPQPSTLLNVDPRTQSFLVARSQKLDIKSKLGRKQTLDKSRKDGGFFCQVCKELYKCDIAFFTHLNSATHNRKLGMSLKVEESSVDSVKSKLANLSKSKPAMSAIEFIMKKSMKKKEKIQAKVEEKEERVDRQVDKILEQRKPPPPSIPPPQPKVQDQPLQPKIQRSESQEHEDSQPVQDQQQPKVQQAVAINQSTLEVPDQTEQLMRQMGLPTSFGSKKHKRK